MYQQVTTTLLFTVIIATISAQRQEPPKIKEPVSNTWSDSTVYIRTSTPAEFHCRADGFPTPTYKWTLNGVEIGKLGGREASCNDILSVTSDGTLKVSKDFVALCNGEYQCVAENSNGKSMTPYLTLNRTVTNPFEGDKGAPPEVKSKNAYQYLVLPCKDIPESSPPYTISWYKTDPRTQKQTRVIEDERIVTDPQGSIHFLWVLPDDNDWTYVCAGYNNILLSENKNTITYRLDIRHGSSAERSPQSMYDRDVTAMQGTTAQLLCVFSYYYSGNDALKITWLKRGSLVEDGPTYEIHDFGRQLHVKDVQVPITGQKDVEGVYICRAELPGHSEVEGSVKLTVVAPPVFTSEGRLNDIKAPIGGRAEFTCHTYSHHTYSKPVVWMKNGDPIVGCVRPKSFECTAKSEGHSQCIPASQHCDNLGQCLDESDEQNCPKSCGEGMKLCNNICINLSDQCDEQPCNFRDFQCADKSSCIKERKKCDGVDDCSDKSDEKACPGSPDETVGRFTLKGDRTKLILNNVNTNDNMCIQCLVENDYGTLFGDGCLTVINKIEVTKRPNSTYIMEPGDSLTIEVDATTDPLVINHMNYEWFWEIKEKPHYEKLPPVGKYFGIFMLSMKEKRLTINMPDVNEKQLSSYELYRNLTNRKFFIKIGHEYESLMVNFTIEGIDVAPPVTEPTVQSAGGDLWWLAIILGVIFLIIIVIIIFCYLYRNRGGVYLLDKKEHKAGHDPEQELKDSGFHDVGRVGTDDYEDEKPRADEVSLTESVKPYDSDEDITEEYGGDFDVSKFNEDGSFIGIYGEKKSKPKEATV